MKTPNNWSPEDVDAMVEGGPLISETCPTKLEEAMAAALIFMPEIGHLTVPVTREIIQRCARVAVAFGARIDGGEP